MKNYNERTISVIKHFSYFEVNVVLCFYFYWRVQKEEYFSKDNSYLCSNSSTNFIDY